MFCMTGWRLLRSIWIGLFIIAEMGVGGGEAALAADVSACYPNEFVEHLAEKHKIDSGVLVGDEEQFLVGYSFGGEAECSYIVRFRDCVSKGIEKAGASIHFLADGRAEVGLEHRSLSILANRMAGVVGVVFSYRAKEGGWVSGPSFSNLKVKGGIGSGLGDEIGNAFRDAQQYCSFASASDRSVSEAMKKFVDGVAVQLKSEKDRKDAEEVARSERLEAETKRRKRLLVEKCVREQERRAAKNPSANDPALNYPAAEFKGPYAPRSGDTDYVPGFGASAAGSLEQECARVGVSVGVDVGEEQHRRRFEDYESRRNRPRTRLRGFGVDN